MGRYRKGTGTIDEGNAGWPQRRWTGLVQYKFSALAGWDDTQDGPHWQKRSHRSHSGSASHITLLRTRQCIHKRPQEITQKMTATEKSAGEVRGEGEGAQAPKSP